MLSELEPDQTLCQPLKHVTKGPALLHLASAHEEDAEEKILQYPDLDLQIRSTGIQP